MVDGTFLPILKEQKAAMGTSTRNRRKKLSGPPGQNINSLAGESANQEAANSPDLEKEVLFRSTHQMKKNLDKLPLRTALCHKIFWKTQ